MCTRMAISPGIGSIGLLAAMTVVLTGQTRPGRTPALMADGHPDLQGTYDVSTVTPLERAVQQPLELTAEQARKSEQQVLNLVALANRPSSPTRSAPPLGGDGSTGNSGNVGGYNVYWIGGLPSRVTVLDGRPRASLIVDPPDGRLPPAVPAAPAPNDAFASDRRRARQFFRTSITTCIRSYGRLTT